MFSRKSIEPQTDFLMQNTFSNTISTGRDAVHRFRRQAEQEKRGPVGL